MSGTVNMNASGRSSLLSFALAAAQLAPAIPFDDASDQFNSWLQLKKK